LENLECTEIFIFIQAVAA